MSTSRPFFLSFEGIDACGKSTQVKLLLNQMNKSSNNTILVREPGGSIISERIREILLDKNLHEMSERTEALLMTASRSQLTYEKILENLNRGIAKFKAEGKVGSELAVKAEFSLVLPNELKKYI